MPPQPLSLVMPHATVSWGAGFAFEKRPSLAPLVAEAISAWAYAEATMGDILIRMLGARGEPAAKMYSAIVSTTARLDALSAAARCSLQSRYLEMFDALKMVVKPVAGARNRLAHDLWCYSDDLPDALLLLDASASFDFFVERNTFHFDQDARAAAIQGKRPPPLFPMDRVFVYREQELTEILTAVREVHQLLALFVVVASGHQPQAESNFRELELEPRIQTALARLRKRSENAP